MRCKLTVSTKMRSQWLLWVVMAKANLHWWNVTWLQCKLWCRELRRQHSNSQWCNTMGLFSGHNSRKNSLWVNDFQKVIKFISAFAATYWIPKEKKFFRWEGTKKFWHRGIWYKSNQINDFWYLSLGFQAFLTFHCPVDCYLRVFLGSTEGWFL